MEPKILVKQTCIIINDYNWNDCPKLQNYFKVPDPATRYHTYYYLILHYDEENKRLYLPRGIDIWLVEKLLNEEAYVEVGKHSKYDYYKDMKIRYKPRDHVQVEGLKFMLGKDQYRMTGSKSQLCLQLNTGKGKTYLSIATMVYTGIKSIVITYSVEWLKQWAEKVKEYTNITDKEICLISGSGTIYRLLSKSPEQIYKYKMFLVTHATIKSYGDANGWDKVTELFEHLKVGIKFIDEAHMNFTNIAMIDYYTNVFKTFYITATAERSSRDENRIYQLSFKNILAIDLYNKDEDAHTKYIAIKYHSKPNPGDVSACKGAYGLDRNKYVNYIVTNERFRMMTIVLMGIILPKLNNPNDKCLIFVETNNAILVVRDLILSIYPELNGSIGIFTSINKDKEEAKNNRIILSTVKSAGAAVDIAGLKVTLVLASPFKSTLLTRQTLGRTRADNTLYLELVDMSFYYCQQYYRAKLPTLNKYATECLEINIDDQELHDRYNSIIESRTRKLIKPIEFVEERPLIKPIYFVN